MRAALLALLGLSFVGLLAALRSPRGFELDVGRPGDERFLHGFHDREAADTLDFRWTAPGSTLVLHGADAAAYELILRLNPGAARRRLRLVLDRKIVARAELAPGWQAYRFPLPQAGSLPAFRGTPVIKLAFEQYWAAHDGRALGAMLDRVWLEPAAGRSAPWGSAVARALEMTLGLALLAAALFASAGRLGRGAPPRIGLVIVPTAASALGLVLLTREHPCLLAWALPFTPVFLGLASLAWLAARYSTALAAPATTTPFGGEASPHSSRLPSWVPLAGIVLLALGIRFYRLTELPWALWRDEARHGLIALRMLREGDYRPIYIPEANIPALGLYPFALALKLWGIQSWTYRPVTALAGGLSVLPLYGLARLVSSRRDVALLAAGLLAASSWHLAIGRLQFTYILEPALSLTGLFLLARALLMTPTGRARRIWLAAAGGCLGLDLHTYHSARFTPVLAALLVSLLWTRCAVRARDLLPLALAFATAAAPLALYALLHPRDFNKRVSQVFLLSQAAGNAEAPLASLDASLGRHLLMFNVRGDENGRHHSPGRPLLDPLTGLGFLAGIATLLRNLRLWPSRFLLSALAITTLPSLLAVDGPHAGRSIAAAGFAAIVAGLGFVAAFASFRRRPLLLGLVLAGAVALNCRLYFVSMAKDPRVYGAGYPVHTQIGLFLKERAETADPRALSETYVSAKLAQNEVFAYLTNGLELSTFDAGAVSHPPAPGALFVLSGYAHHEEAIGLARYLGEHPAPSLIGPAFPGSQAPSYVVYRVPAP